MTEKINSQPERDYVIYSRQSAARFLDDMLAGTSGTDLTVVAFRVNVSAGDIRDEAMEVVGIVKAGIRKTDIIAALSDTEFLLIFPGCGVDVVESIMGTIEKKTEVYVGSGGSADVSIAYAISPAAGIDADRLIESLMNKIKP